MKRPGQLFPKILELENLQRATEKALRGKRTRRDAQDFVRHLDQNLARLQDELVSGRVRVGQYDQFVIHDPKRRTITAPCFRERVLHHAIMNVCEPVFERWLIPDTYACRVGQRATGMRRPSGPFAARHEFFLKMDVRKYFDSVPHDTLLQQLCRRFKDPPLLQLWQRIVESYSVTPERGLPIGALTSQHLANLYLGTLDRYIKETCRVRGYVRYMDDFVVWANGSRPLRSLLEDIGCFLDSRLSLRLRENCVLNRTAFGMDFLGLRVYRDHLRLSRRSKVRYARKMRILEDLYELGYISEQELQRRAGSLTAFITTPGVASWRFRATVVQRLKVGGPRP